MAKQRRLEKDFPGQHEGEEVQFLFRQHPLVMRKALVLGLFAILLGVLPLDFPIVWQHEAVANWLIKLALVVPVIVLAAWAYRWLGWYYTVYLVTNERMVLITQKGFFDRQVEEWQLDAITNVNYHIGGFQAAIFGYGDIVAKTYVGDVELKYIHKPAEIHEDLLEAVRDAGGSTQLPVVC